jgi:hypothetical protein
VTVRATDAVSLANVTSLARWELLVWVTEAISTSMPQKSH